MRIWKLNHENNYWNKVSEERQGKTADSPVSKETFQVTIPNTIALKILCKGFSLFDGVVLMLFEIQKMVTSNFKMFSNRYRVIQNT